MPSLLDDLVAAGILSSEVLHRFRTEHALPDWALAQELVRLNLLEEPTVLAQASRRYGLPLLPASHSFPPFPDAPLREHLQHQFGIRLYQSGSQVLGVLTLESRWDGMAQATCCLNSPLKWYLGLQEGNALTPPDDRVAYGAEAQAEPVLEQLLEEALELRSSDLHLDPTPEGATLRLRIDGHLRDQHLIPPDLRASLTSRVKILSGMDIAVRRRPQDGHFVHHSQGGRLVDVRVSSMPSLQGEKLVLRLLDQVPVQHRLDALGFLEADLPVLQQAAQAPSGLILLVGPTGSGKTTTLYALLRTIHSREKHLFTIENPVEYQIPGITQVSVDPEAGLGFAEALRAALRQDPDVLLVGEIRDEETAGIALKAALTGHLVLSTLHSNNAVTALQRLENLGLGHDLLAETLLLVVAQRLVRRCCPPHRHRAVGCPHCQGTGYSGRVPVYEVLEVGPVVQERIREGKTGADLVTPHPEVYFRRLEETARALVQAGLTDEKETGLVLV